MVTATGLRSLLVTFRPNRCASSGMLARPPNMSQNSGMLPLNCCRIISWARSMIFLSVVAFQVANSATKSNSFSRALRASLGGRPSPGSSISCANRIARDTDNGVRAHQLWIARGWPFRNGFSVSGLDPSLIAANGSATSISFFGCVVIYSRFRSCQKSPDPVHEGCRLRMVRIEIVFLEGLAHPRARLFLPGQPGVNVGLG